MNGYGPKDLAAAFRTVRKNTVQIAEDIPEDKYGFVAAPGVKSVRAMLSHIIYAPCIQEGMHRGTPVTTLKGFDFSALHAKNGPEEQKTRTKAETVDLLKSEGERIAKWLESTTPDFLAQTFTDTTGQNPRTRFEGLMGVKEHEMHHRGQLMLIERLLGIVPHLTRQREEMMRQRQVATAARQ
jgi:uncharacterized damage-inducible protein DinB